MNPVLLISENKPLRNQRSGFLKLQAPICFDRVQKMMSRCFYDD